MGLSRTSLLTAVLVVIALFVGSLLDAHLPRLDRLVAEPFLRTGTVGEPVNLRTVTVTVTGVRSGKEVESLRTVSVTTAVWLVVDYVVEARGEERIVAPTNLRLKAADGRLFGGTPGVVVSCPRAQPGVPITCSVPFEVPADAVAGSRLLVPAEADVDLMDDVASIDLGLTPDRAEVLASDTTRVIIAPTVGRP